MELLGWERGEWGCSLKSDGNAPDGEFKEGEMRATPGLVVPKALKLYVHCAHNTEQYRGEAGKPGWSNHRKAGNRTEM